MFSSLSSTIRTRLPSTVRLLRRQREDEAAAVPGLALDPDAAAVELDETLRKGEAETGALALLDADIGLLELFEDPLPVGGSNARTSVGDRHPHLAVDPRRGDDDAASLRGELDRVR